MAARLEQLVGGFWAVICGDHKTQEDSRREAEQVFLHWQKAERLKALFAKHGIEIKPHDSEEP